MTASAGFSLLVLAAATAAVAQPPVTPLRFRVEGDVRVQVASPFTLHVEGSYEITLWSSRTAEVTPAGSSASISAAPGRHRVTFEAYRILWDERRTVYHRASEVFEVIGTAPDDPPDHPDPKPDPDPPDVERIRQVSREAARALADPTTARRLYEAINGIDPSGPLEDVRLRYQRAVADVLLTRTGEARNKPWIRWREAVSKAIEAIDPTSTAQYVAAIAAAIEPLRGETSTTVTKTITLYKRPG